jgi:hypothetical protein
MTKAACTVVGGFTDTIGEQLTLAERRHRSSWSVQPTPQVVVVAAAQFNGVSCPSAVACAAVGLFGGPWTGSSFGLWNGSRWSAQPLPANTGVSLTGVSCPTATACIAVGTGQELAEAWDGSSWTIQNTPDPTDAADISLDGVSCATASACTAVGFYYQPSSAQTVTLAEAWNGSSWTIQNTPNSAGNNVLNSVSCTSETACTAVGYRSPPSGPMEALVERWEGTSWTIQNTPSPSGGASRLTAVSCTTATACTAVGGLQTLAPLLVERYS